MLAAGVSLAWPRVSRAATGQVAANDKLAIGIIGAGGPRLGQSAGRERRSGSWRSPTSTTSGASEALKAFPQAAHYRDFREMLDKEKSLDAVVVSTPDHTHAVAAIAAMRHGLHVYCEKPLAPLDLRIAADGRGGAARPAS